MQSEGTKMPENTGALKESSRFKKGQSGNPQGKPKGARNKSTLAAEALLEGSLDKICKRVEEEALNGNMQAAKMILDRFIPVRKDRVILGKFISPNGKKSKYAMAIYDPSLVDFDVSTLDIKTDVVFVLPDNGRRVLGDEIPKGSYKITYG